MKKTCFFLFAFLVPGAFLAGPPALPAHPPSDVSIEFDAVTKVLKVTVVHSSRDAKKHYIDDVAVSLNGKTVITQKFGRQTDKAGQAVSYILPDAESGDTISVTADCNLAGKMKRELKVK